GFVNTVLTGLFGFGAYVLPFAGILVCIAVIFMKDKYIDTPRIVMGVALFFITISFAHVLGFKSAAMPENLWAYIAESFQRGALDNGGLLGAAFGNLFVQVLGKTGAYILLVSAGVVLLILITGKSLFALINDLSDRATDIVEKSRYREIEPEYDEKPFRVESIRKRKMDVYDIPRRTRSQKVFDYTIGSDGPADLGQKVELINDRIKRRNKTVDDSIYDTNFNTARDVLGVIENESADGIIPFPTIPVEGEPPKFNLSEEPGFELKFSGSGIETAAETTEAEKEPDFADTDIKIVEKVDELEALLESAGIEPVEGKKKKKTALEPIDITDEVESAAGDLPAHYIMPPIDLLKENNTTTSLASRTQIYENSKKLEQTLKSFGVEARVVEVSKGPTVTRYELSPGLGVKVSKISGLSDDLALGLAAVGIRIEAPIPGKSVVGIEIPNKEVQPVFLREVIEDEAFQEYPSKLAFALGKDIAGNVVVTDIARMPHMLIAGSTGSGKSVCINTLVTSILYKARPDEVKLLMVDPKVVELSIYNGIPHLLIPVVTDPKKAAGALNWAVVEMNHRYKLFADSAVRDLKGYNQWKKEHGDKDIVPQIVIIIDELADLMMAAPGEVEESICRLAQMARAAGIHLVIATQRPSVDVITGLIKANVPSRLAFAVSSGTDSRTIIDQVGAEKLLGKGDMLFNPVGLSKPQRIQGAFVSDKEVEALVSFLKNGFEQEYDPEMVEKITANVKTGGEITESDELLEEAVAFIIEKEKASVSMLQRRFRVGYNRAARLMEELETRGVVGPEDGSKPRKVYMTSAEWQEYKETKL
ncbi:MAG: DNA translocase FtsK, partial [Clostridiales bacterium]|nr:DNA translocase FtsK [Clostridiales bacterium]